ncbi:MAG: hypothetical protein Q4C58_00610 [Eubacteriales bacterium]|nr:hypothetical protein [Eubacteriales bacterium]
MERLKRILNRFLFPGTAAVLLSVPVAAALLIYTFSQEKEYSLVAYVSYAVSAYSLIIVCAFVARFPKQGFKEALHRNRYIHLYLTDVSFKTHVSLYISLGINLLFVAVKLFYGVYYRSVWFATLAVYYIMLAVMRFLLLRHVNRSGIGKDFVSELRRYRMCGIILLLMNVALLGVVVLVVLDNEGFYYAGYLIYVVAMYAFYNIITAVVEIVKYRRFRSPVMSAAKVIKLAAALVSMLSLETAMLAQFGEENSAQFRMVMTGLTGGCVCLIVLVAAVIMIRQSAKQMEKQKIAEM